MLSCDRAAGMVTLKFTHRYFFEFDWDAFMLLPSRASAEPLNQDARARLMARVRAQGYIDDYSGTRVARSGRRFVSVSEPTS